MSITETLQLARLNGQAEIFYSIQGEGKSMGRPSVFIRTSLCNLHCIWCDTDYTWNWVGTRFEHVNDQRPGYQKFDKKEWIANCEIETVVQAVTAYPCRNIILTGGEPMLQQAALVTLMRKLSLIDPVYRFEVETNGTLVAQPDFEALIDQFNVSPKLENSNNPRKLREKPKAYQFFAKNAKAFFKFVVAEKSDLSEILELLSRYAIPPEKVWLMPEGRERQSLTRRRQWLVEICKTHGFNYTDRLHIQIWGSRKGV